MTAFQIVCTVINFIVLAGGIWYFGGKALKKALRERSEKIAAELAKAESDLKDASEGPEKLAQQSAEGEQQLAKLTEAARVRLQTIEQKSESQLESEKKRSQSKYGEAYEREMKAMNQRVGYGAVKHIAQKAMELVSAEPYASVCARSTPGLAAQALEAVRLTCADRVRLQEGHVLTAELRSAHALDASWLERLQKKCDGQTAGAGTVQCTACTDPSLLAGARITVGDTLYDMSLLGALNRLSAGKKGYAGGSDADGMIAELISGAEVRLDVCQLGRVISVSDEICHIEGLSDVMIGEMVELPRGVSGMVLDLDESTVGCALMGEYEKVCEGDKVRRTGLLMEAPVGDELIGRVVNVLGEPIDGGGPIGATHFRAIECPAPSVIDRKGVSVPLQTGLKAIDSLVPIGRGQRELIIGDRQTGKTAIALDAIINQRGKDVICIYVAVGQKESTVAAVVDRLRQYGAMDYSIVVSANAYEAAPMLYLAPYAGAAMGEYFMYDGRDVLIVFDDLSKQAVAYRELSLLLHRPAGREAYPGDVFYLHSRLLERAARLSDGAGGGSMTALPIIETQAGDIAAYIPTNVISITDGQIFLESELFNQGVRPAVNVGLSVSRVGGAAQTGPMKQVAGSLRVELAQYRELAAFAQFGSDLDENTRKVLALGDRQTEVLKQGQYQPMPMSHQVLIIYAVSQGFANEIPVSGITAFSEGLISYFEESAPELLECLGGTKKLTEEQFAAIRGQIVSYLEGAVKQEV